jgi:hypothetical protein
MKVGSMDRVLGFQPALSRMVNPTWRRARALWRSMMSTLSDPYRPEQHYMRGPGPKCRERHGGERAAATRFVTDSAPEIMTDWQAAAARTSEFQKSCPKCTSMMVLERVAPKFGPLPELRTYKCLQCSCVIKEEVD